MSSLPAPRFALTLGTASLRPSALPLVLWVFVSGHTETAIGPLGVALIIVVICNSLGGPTGCAINPARDLGPRIAHAILPIKGKGGSDWAYSWVPVVAPIVGAVLGTVLYFLVLV